MTLDNVLKKGQIVLQRYFKKFCRQCILFFLKHFENGIRVLYVPYKYVKELLS